jgi:small subunit ribosomal protein S18
MANIMPEVAKKEPDPAPASVAEPKVEKIDYKDTARLRKFTSDRAKILPRRVTGTCAYHQRELTTAIKRARNVALLPYSEG